MSIATANRSSSRRTTKKAKVATTKKAKVAMKKAKPAKRRPTQSKAATAKSKAATAKSKLSASAIKIGKMVYAFGPSRTEGNATQKLLLGGKGANLADMTSIGLPVPPGFTITTETCGYFSQNGGRLPH